MAMQRYAEFRVLSSRIHQAGDDRLRVTGHRHTFVYEPRPGMLYVRSRAISSRTNDNHDNFPPEEIKAAWETFRGKPVFVNHHNEDPSRARGVIVDAALHEDTNPDGSPDTWVEVLMEVDAVRFPRLAKAILDEDIQRTSMGTNVAHSECSFCGNRAETPLDYCAHIARLKGRRIARTTVSGEKEHVLVYEICRGLGFFENSLLVEQPADPTAYFLGVDTRGLQMSAGRRAASPDRRRGRSLVAALVEEGSLPPATADRDYTDLDLPLQSPRREASVSQSPSGTRVAAKKPSHVHEFVDPTGRVHKHPSVRDYSHGVFARPLPYWQERDPENHPADGFNPLSFHARPDLAEKSANDFRSRGFENVTVIPVRNPRPKVEPTAGLLAEAAGPRHPNPGDHPYFQANPVHHDHIVSRWNEATPEERGQGESWYADAHLVAKAIGKGDAHKGAGVLAAYSPKTAWPVNMHNAARALNTGVAPGGPGGGVMATTVMRNQAQKIIDGTPHDQVLKSPKISHFAHLIEHGGNADPADPRTVVDRHALSVATGRRLSDAEIEQAPLHHPHYYGHVVGEYHKAAKRISEQEGREVHPHQVQAATWLVQQRRNAEQDSAGKGNSGGRGRARSQENAANAWQDYARQHHPELVGPAWHHQNTAGRRLAFGEQVAPPQVDTLRPEACPICSDRDTFDGEGCKVCGYIAPPEQFQDPDLDAAGEADLRDGEEDPTEEVEDDDDAEDGDDPDRRNGVGGMSDTKTKNAAQAQRSRLVAALRGQQERLDAQERHIGSLEEVLAFVVETAGLGGHPRVAALSRTAGKSAGWRSGYDRGRADRRTRADMRAEAKVAEWGAAEPDWQDGWSEGYQAEDAAQQAVASRTAATGDQEGDPVARDSGTALAPDAVDHPENYGTVPAPANAEVTPDATTDVQSTDVAIPAAPFNVLEDVTEQRDLVPPPPGEAAHVQQDNTPGPAAPRLDPAYPMTGWTASADPQARFFAALRLARLRRSAGLSTDDELALHHSIATDASLSDRDIDVETRTLEAMRPAAGQASRAASAPASRSLVPRAAAQTRAVVSLATGDARPAPQPLMSTAGVTPSSAEFGDL